MTRVLSVASECAPLVKTGGLADVAGALPGALDAHGVEMRTLLPGYRQIMGALEKPQPVMTLAEGFGGAAQIVTGKAAGLTLYVLDAPHLFDRGATIYLGEDGKDWPDNPQRFAALSRAAVQLAERGHDGWHPDVLHAHDWQGGLAPYYLSRSSVAGRLRSVITVHNVAFQGLAPASLCGALHIDPADFTADGIEYFGQISALKAGLVFADKLTTVSPRYAEELMTPEFGMGLDGVMRARRADLSGVLNGIDDAVWSPELDPHITPYKSPRTKTPNTQALREEFGLPDADGPLCVVVSRLTGQKGLDLLLEALPELLSRGGQLALLGSGDPHLENAWREMGHDPNVGVRIGYDEALSHRMIAGGDAILVPSRFEPCGLTQLYGLRYGTLPLVALTGGLADTVINASPAALARGVATGVQFDPVTAEALLGALARLCTLYADAKTWAKMQRNAMAQPVGWNVSAQAYAALYQELTKA